MNRSAPQPLKLLVRADAGDRLGTGHVMRALALAQSWRRRGGEVRFAWRSGTPALARRLRDSGCELVAGEGEPGGAGDAAWLAAEARAWGATWVMLDGYQFGTEYQEAIGGGPYRVLVADDYGHAERYRADLILNQNRHAAPALYAGRTPGAKLLLGPRYALLREDFWRWIAWRRTPRPAGEAAAVMVTLGGSDPDNITAKIVAALSGLPKVRVTAVVGGSNPHRERLQTLVAATGGKCELAVDVADLSALMAAADLAVAAGGTTAWELAFMQLPAALVVLADNQAAVAAALAADGLAVHLGRGASLDPDALRGQVRALLADADRRAVMAARGRALVDGKGGTRVVAAMKQFSPGYKRPPLRDHNHPGNRSRRQPPVARRSAGTSSGKTGADANG